MNTEIDVLVIGLGAMGSAALYHLSRLGAAPIGIEQHIVDHAWGSSHGQSRAFRIFYHDPLYTELALAALPIWRDLEKQSGEQLLTICGNLLFAREGNAKIAKHVGVMEDLQADYELMTPDAVQSRFPVLRLASNMMACFVSQSGFLNPGRAVQVQVEEAQCFGAAVHNHVTVKGIDLSGSRPRVTTTRGDYTCEKLLLTPGPWATQVLRLVDLADLGQQLRVTRQQKFYFQPANPSLFGPDRLPVYADYDRNFYGFPHYGPGLKVADDNRGDLTDPATVDRALDLAKRDELSAWLASIMPGAGLSYVAGSTCMYTDTPDRDFLLGPHPEHSNVFIGAGFSGHGFKFSTLVGKLLAELALELPTSHALARFRLDRF